jgi:hypothetical protein
MKNKYLTLELVDKLDSNLKNLIFELNRNSGPNEVNVHLTNLSENLEKLRGLLSLEENEFGSNQII